MLLFVFGFVGGAVVINSAILVSLSVLLLVHFSISAGVPALTQNLPRILRYFSLLEVLFWLVFLLCLALWVFVTIMLQIETMENGLKLRLLFLYIFIGYCLGIRFVFGNHPLKDFQIVLIHKYKVRVVLF